MREIYVAPHVSRAQKIFATVIGLYLVSLIVYYAVSEAFEYRFGGIFYVFFAIFIVILFVVWFNILKLSRRLIKINEKLLVAGGEEMEWMRINHVEIYRFRIEFVSNGFTKKNIMDLSDVSNKNIQKVKQFITELCEAKKIPCE